MSISIIIWVLLIHFLADFGLQTHEQAINKSKDFNYLCYHTGVYAAVFFVAALCIMVPLHAFAFALATFGCHTLQDYFTSKLVKKYFDKQDYHNGFVVIGADQLLHYLQLIFTLKLLMS